MFQTCFALHFGRKNEEMCHSGKRSMTSNFSTSVIKSVKVHIK